LKFPGIVLEFPGILLKFTEIPWNFNGSPGYYYVGITRNYYVEVHLREIPGKFM
jgi:hypothetical protein